MGACADGDCTNEANAANQLISRYVDKVNQLRSTFGIEGRNVGIATYNINGISNEVPAVSGRTLPGTVGIPSPRFFETFAVGHTREFDSEVKLLETIAHQFAPGPGIYENIRGTVTIFSELPPCPSCVGVIQQFNRMFPNVSVEVLTK